MADSWDAAYPAFQLPGAAAIPAAPATPAAAPSTTAAPSDAWDAAYPSAIPEAPKPTKQEPLKLLYADPMTGMPVYDNQDVNEQIQKQIATGTPKALGGVAAGIAENLMGLPQLAAHAISPITSAPAKAMDSAVDWLTAPGSDEYNVGRQAGYWGSMLYGWPKAVTSLAAKAVPMSASYAEKILSNAGGWFTPNRIAAMTDPYKIQMAAKVAGSADMPGILSSLGDVGSKVAANTLMSLLSRPVENADQNGYWGPKAVQTGIDAAAGGIGPVINAGMNAIQPIKSAIANFISSHPTLSSMGAAGAGVGIAAHPLETLSNLKDLVMDHPTAAAAIGVPALLGALLRQPAVQPYTAPVLGTIAGQVMQNPDAAKGAMNGAYNGFLGYF